MKNFRSHPGCNRKLIVVALLSALGGAAYADDQEIAQLTKPSSEVSLGVGTVAGNTGDRALFGQYSGWRKNDTGLLLDGEVILRDDATGTWTVAKAYNFGLDNRELSLLQQKQGDWKVSLDYSELVRRDPNKYISSVNGIGSTTPVVAGKAGLQGDVSLSTTRKGFTLSGEKWLTSDLLFDASYKTESKEGARNFSVGNYCSNIIGGYKCASTVGAILFLPEPINSRTHQIEAKLSFSADKLNLNAGYYGSIYKNENSLLTPTILTSAYDAVAYPGAAALVGLLQSPVALPPDNEAHQVFVAGNYAFRPWLRGNFNVAYTHATQNEAFPAAVASASLPGNFGAVVNSYLVFAGVTAKPIPKLSMLANWRYEDVQDKTPLALYNGTYTNALSSNTKVNGKAEASYQLPDNYRVTAGGDYAYVRYGRPVDTTQIPTGSLTSVREWTEEGTLRAELRRSMSETFNMALGVSHSKRNGEHWLNLNKAGYPRARWVDIYTANGAFPTTMMDRKRDAVKLSADWNPTNALSIQLSVDNGKDKYTGETQKGMHDTGSQNYGLDASLKLSDDWKLNAHANYAKQTLHVDHSYGYMAALDDASSSLGVGFTGKMAKGFDVGGDYSLLNDTNRYNLNSANADAPGVLPDVTYRTARLKLFGVYGLDANSDVRVDLIHQNTKFNDWTWGYNGVPYALGDGTTVVNQPKQTVTYLGARYVYKFR